MRQFEITMIVLFALVAGQRSQLRATEAEFDVEPVVGLLELLVESADPATARECFGIVAEKVRTREVSPDRLAAMRPRLEPLIEKIIAAQPPHPLHFDAALIAATWKHPRAIEAVRKHVTGTDLAIRGRAVAMLLATGDEEILGELGHILADEKSAVDAKAMILSSLGQSESPRVAIVVLAEYPKFDAALQPKAIELLTQRTVWSKALLEAVGKNEIPPHALNVNQIAKLLASRDQELVKAVKDRWGSLRTERNPQREQVIREVREQLRTAKGDPHRGQEVFNRVCAQCHKIYGEGHDVGPDITLNGRNNYEQLLSNVLDPSLVIGRAYQAATVVTADGRTLTGLIAEDSPQRVVLKIQGGKQEVVPRDEVDVFKLSELSLMPEGLEKQLKPEELFDLFAFLVLDKPPSDPAAKRLAGAEGK